MIANCGHDENGKLSGGAAGDQTGTEWEIRNWYDRPWNVVLRFEDTAIGDLIASLAEQAAENDLIGYDQIQRLTFWEQLRAYGYEPRKIRTACETDCSAGVLAIVKAAGHLLGLPALEAVDPTGYTGTMKKILKGAGAKAYTQPDLTGSEKLLKRGDILLNEGHHTAINLSTGKGITVKITREQLAKEEERVNRILCGGGYTYGDSKTLPPCADHLTACDRGAVALPLWNLGFTDQPKGGITVLNMEKYLTRWGFTKNVDESKVEAGDIVLMRALNQSTPSAAWHTYYVISRNGGTVTKYDYGSQNRINAGGRFTGPIDEWTDKVFYCSFKIPAEHPSYFYMPTPLKAGMKTADAYVMTEAMKARGYKGAKKDGKIQDLELNSEWTKGDGIALAYYKADRARNGFVELLWEDVAAGTASAAVWRDVLGGSLPFECVEVPTCETEGNCVLLTQEFMRARGIKGADGKQIALDRKWGPNTEAAVRKFQKASGLPQTGIVDRAVWMLFFGRTS